MFEQMRWREPSREFPNAFSLTEHRGAEFACPGKDILEQPVMNRFQVVSIEITCHRISEQLIAPPRGVERLEGG
jgi:hypothetical protein